MANHLPDPILTQIFLYHRATDNAQLRELKCVCKSFHSALGNNDALWHDMYSRYVMPFKDRVCWGKSAGSTVLMLRHSMKTRTCLSCGISEKSRYKHPFYFVRLCEDCTRRSPFRVESLRAMCDLFFLDRTQVKREKLVSTAKVGRAMLVLFDKVKKVAEDIYPDGLLKTKMDEREHKRLMQSIRKIESRRRRTEEEKLQFSLLVSQYSSRIDPLLRNEERVQEAARYFDAFSLLCGDFYEDKITSHITPKIYAKNQVEFAELLTFMKKLGLLDQDMTYYIRDPFNNINPKFIFRSHLRDGLHFYDQAHQYALAEQQLRTRVKQVHSFIDGNMETLRTSYAFRRQLCLSMCVEDGVDYCPVYFKDFMSSLIGDPCTQARRLRCFKFLEERGYREIVEMKLSYGFSMDAAMKSATRIVLDKVNGFPVMTRTCVIDLSPSLASG